LKDVSFIAVVARRERLCGGGGAPV
jgi:hypothetical protein